MRAWGFKVRGEGSQSLDIDVYDVIGEGWWEDGVTAKAIRRALKGNPNAKAINLRINSEGGDVLDGFAIFNLLTEHPAKVHVQIDSIAASMASVIAMAGDTISMASNAFLMIHNPWGGVVGEADDLRAYADVLDKMSGNIAGIYAKRSGMALDSVIAAMDSETWYTSDEAKAVGLITAITGEAKLAACLRGNDYRNAPAALRAVATAKTTPPGGRAMENRSMKVIALALKLAETADESQILAAVAGIHGNVDKLLKAAGQTDVDAAVGAIAANATAATRLKELEAETEAKESAQLLRELQADGKITPAQEKDLWPTMSLASKRSFHATAVRVLGRDGAREKQDEGKGPITTADEKKWEDLAPKARADLFQTNKALYDALKADYEKRNPNS